MSTLDWRGVLERAGADAAAPEGSQSWALAHVEAAVSELIDAAGEMNRLAKGPPGGVSQADKRSIIARMAAALARVQGGAA